MESTLTFVKNGKEIVIKASYKKEMVAQTVNADGDIIETGKHEVVTEEKMSVYVNGKLIGESTNSNFWALVDCNGAKKIWGLPVGFTNVEDAHRYEAWLNDLINGAEAEEIEKDEENEESGKVEHAKSVIAKAEAQHTIPSRDEAKKMMDRYNDMMNECGEGYVPHIVSMEEYENAKSVVENAIRREQK